MSLEGGAGNIEGSGSLPQNAPYRPCELELSDDGSSMVSDAEPEHAHGLLCASWPVARVRR